MRVIRKTNKSMSVFTGGSVRVVVTGSEGLVGRELLARAASALAGWEIVPIDVALNPASDFRCSALWSSIGPFDGIIHLGAISRVAWGEAQPDLCRSVNVDGTMQVVAAAEAQGAWLLFASSREVYGDPERLPVREDDRLAPVNHYGISKRDGENLVREAQKRGLRSSIVRLSSVYGNRRDHPDRAIPALVSHALAGRELVLTGGDHVFDFVHVRDVVDGLVILVEQLAAGAQSLPTVHLATGVATSLNALAALAVAVTGSASSIRSVSPRPFDVAGFVGDPRFASETFGWRAATDLRSGITEVADDLRRNGSLDPAAIPVGLTY